MGTLLPDFKLKDAEDEFFFSSAIENKIDNIWYVWKDDSLMGDMNEVNDMNKFYLGSDNIGVYRITDEGKITSKVS
jgi:hypothetical protein